jgi:hypothetical protein
MFKIINICLASQNSAPDPKIHRATTVCDPTRFHDTVIVV